MGSAVDTFALELGKALDTVAEEEDAQRHRKRRTEENELPIAVGVDHRVQGHGFGQRRQAQPALDEQPHHAQHNQYNAQHPYDSLMAKAQYVSTGLPSGLCDESPCGVSAR